MRRAETETSGGAPLNYRAWELSLSTSKSIFTAEEHLFSKAFTEDTDQRLQW